MVDTEAARVRLETERDRLQAVLSGRATGEGDLRSDQLPAEQAAETLNRELDTSVERRVRTELEEVEAALRRLDGGRYGLCEVCGQEIPAGRLEALPAARYCVTDQARAERHVRTRPSR
jgi:DnaK suppressor protein